MLGDYSRGVRGVVGSGEGRGSWGGGWGGFRGGMGVGHSEYMSRPKINVLSSAKTEEVLAATSNPDCRVIHTGYFAFRIPLCDVLGTGGPLTDPGSLIRKTLISASAVSNHG